MVLLIEAVSEMDQGVLTGGVCGGVVGMAGVEEVGLELLHHTVEGIASFTGDVVVEIHARLLLLVSGLARTLLAAFLLPTVAVDLSPPIRRRAAVLGRSLEVVVKERLRCGRDSILLDGHERDVGPQLNQLRWILFDDPPDPRLVKTDGCQRIEQW